MLPLRKHALHDTSDLRDPIDGAVHSGINTFWKSTQRLVVFRLPLWKMMEWKSVGMMKFPTEWKVIKFHGSKPPTRTYPARTCLTPFRRCSRGSIQPSAAWFFSAVLASHVPVQHVCLQTQTFAEGSRLGGEIPRFLLRFAHPGSMHWHRKKIADFSCGSMRFFLPVVHPTLVFYG